MFNVRTALVATVSAAAIAALVLIAPGCQTIRDFVSPPPGCRAAAQAQVAQYLKDGWQIADVGPAGEAADYIIFLKAKQTADGTTLDVETWVNRLDGSDPDDAALETNGFTQDSTCRWDGDEKLPANIGPAGSFWKRTGQQSLPAGGKS